MYIIKMHYEATAKNVYRAGEIYDHYSGKGGWTIGKPNVFPSEREIKRNGYSTLATAKRVLRSAQKQAERETQYGWWIVTAELVEC